jgi:hypothetical protein
MAKVMRFRVNIKDVDPSTDVTNLARQIAEFIRNMIGSDVTVNINDNDPTPPSAVDAAARGRR